MIFLYFTWGPEAFYMVAAQTWGNMQKFTIIAVPLFIFLAMILERSGVANDLYDMMYIWFGGVGGGLAIGTVIICAIFSAMCGISGAAVVSMGTIALPSMLKYNYDKELALGCINSGGGWGILIPPSVIMILYSLLTGESVGKLFAGGVFPGLLLLCLVSTYIAVRCYFQPHLGPPLPEEERGDWTRKFKALKGGSLADRHRAHGSGVHHRGNNYPHGSCGHGRFGFAYLSHRLQATELAGNERSRHPYPKAYRYDYVDSLWRVLL